MSWQFSALLVLATAGCGNSGEFQENVGGEAEQTSEKPETNHRSYFTARPGGDVQVIEEGKTMVDGTHGWISINSIRTTRLEAAGKIMVINKPLKKSNISVQ